MDILGIIFCESLKQVGLLNRQIILQKMENHINKLSQRHLSLKRNTIILNTLILAKTAYLSNVFPIPQNILPQIHNNIFKYIWPNKKQEPTARKHSSSKKKKEELTLKSQKHKIYQ